MKLPPRYVTIIGLVIAIVASLTDPALVPFLTTILGDQATAKIAALGALIAAVGRALFPPSAAAAP